MCRYTNSTFLVVLIFGFISASWGSESHEIANNSSSPWVSWATALGLFESKNNFELEAIEAERLVETQNCYEFYEEEICEYGTPLEEEESVPPADKPRLAVMGDSVSVASLAHPKLFWDLNRLDKVIFGPALNPPTKGIEKDFQFVLDDNLVPVMPLSNRILEQIQDHPELEGLEKTKKFGELFLINNLGMKYLTDYFEIEELGMPYLLGRSLGVDPDEIYLAAIPGRRSGDSLLQARMILRKLKRNLPEFVTWFMTGNDLCSSNLNDDVKKKSRDYANNLFRGLKELMDKGEVPKESETKIFVLAHLPIAQLWSKSVQDRKTYAFGKEFTCSEFRKYEPKNELPLGLSEDMQRIVRTVISTVAKGRKNLPPIKELCRSVFSLDPDKPKEFEKGLAAITAFTTAYQNAASAAVKKANQYRKEKHPRKAITFHYLDSPSRVTFTGEHMANDCFHPNAKFSQYLTRLLYREIRKKDLVKELPKRF